MLKNIRRHPVRTLSTGSILGAACRIFSSEPCNWYKPIEETLALNPGADDECALQFSYGNGEGCCEVDV